MLSEFREIDSYLTESDSDSSYEAMEGAQPTLAQTEFDNSILRMGRSLVAASKAHPIIEGGSELPNITLRLTRLDPTAPEGDPRLGETVRLLQDMGIHVELGERQDSELPEGVVHDKGPSSRASSPPPPPPPLTPSADINLDLSVLIALISDLTHARLPRTVEDANTRFIPPQSYREWKHKKNGMYGKKKKKKKKTGAAQGAQAQARSASPSPSPSSSPTPSSPAPPAEVSPETLPSDLAKHSRALTNQLLQEMGKGLLHELASKMACAGGAVRFWTTREARDRCLRIVAKIGGASERRRARALFWEGVKEEEEGEEKVQSGEEAEEMYWRGSRYPMRFVGLFPIHLYEAALSAPTTTTTTALPPFFDDLAQTCRDILAQETIPHPRALPEALVSEDAGPPPLVAAAEIPARQGEIQRAVVTKANPRLTAHTVQSLRIGAERGWTTLTANKASVKAILREMKGARGRGGLGGVGGGGGGEEKRAAIWIVDPRSLAEGMSNTR
ncbi:hypothetical protein H0H87_004736 [Tephrocybe sp. NHM501043]|nr:hypothetical protein H0H87_004736 [Tephrocybe sp. NHM501043]